MGFLYYGQLISRGRFLRLIMLGPVSNEVNPKNFYTP